MDEQEVREHRYRFFAEKGVEIAAEQDRTLITLFTGIVAGLIAILLSKDVGFWAGSFFLAAAGSAIVGLAMCLLHMAFSSKVMSLYAAIFGGDENVPNLLVASEATQHALTKCRAFTQLCYTGQLTCLFWAAMFAGFGMSALLWPTIGWSGALGASCFVVLLAIGTIWPMVKVYGLARRAFAAQNQSGDE